MADQLFRILAQLDNHFAADDRLPADAARWRELKRHIVRFKDALDLARIALDRSSPDAATALKHVQWGLGVEDKRP